MLVALVSGVVWVRGQVVPDLCPRSPPRAHPEPCPSLTAPRRRASSLTCCSTPPPVPLPSLLPSAPPLPPLHSLPPRPLSQGVARALRYQCGVARGFTLQDEHLFHCFVSLSSQAFKTTDGFRMMESKLKACEAQVLMSTQMAMDGLHCDTLVRTIMEHTKKLTSVPSTAQCD